MQLLTYIYDCSRARNRQVWRSLPMRSSMTREYGACWAPRRHNAHRLGEPPAAKVLDAARGCTNTVRGLAERQRCRSNKLEIDLWQVWSEAATSKPSMCQGASSAATCRRHGKADQHLGHLLHFQPVLSAIRRCILSQQSEVRHTSLDIRSGPRAVERLVSIEDRERSPEVPHLRRS